MRTWPTVPVEDGRRRLDHQLEAERARGQLRALLEQHAELGRGPHLLGDRDLGHGDDEARGQPPSGAVVLLSTQLSVGTIARLEKSFAARANGRLVDCMFAGKSALGRALEIFRENFERYRDGRELLNRVDKQAGY